uniref:Uncharacterized protein n=1 Tax=Mycena chlorophos TaxID=658473 RepID=A0ABQ0L2Z5_MYCCL|nr:predicted protein [Mycena chlorophos]
MSQTTGLCGQPPLLLFPPLPAARSSSSLSPSSSSLSPFTRADSSIATPSSQPPHLSRHPRSRVEPTAIHRLSAPTNSTTPHLSAVEYHPCSFRPPQPHRPQLPLSSTLTDICARSHLHPPTPTGSSARQTTSPTSSARAASMKHSTLCLPTSPSHARHSSPSRPAFISPTPPPQTS